MWLWTSCASSQVHKRLVDVEELLAADEVFCTGTAVVVNPVGSITNDTRRYNTVHCPIFVEFFSNSMWLLVGIWFFCTQHLLSFQCMLGGGSVEVWTKDILQWIIGVKFILACEEVLKWLFGPRGTKLGCSLFKFKHYRISEHAPHYKWKEKIVLYAKQPMKIHGNKLLAISPLELILLWPMSSVW